METPVCTSKVPQGPSMTRNPCNVVLLAPFSDQDRYLLLTAGRPPETKPWLLGDSAHDTTGHVEMCTRKRIAPEYTIYNNPSSGELYCSTIRDGFISRRLLLQPVATSRGHPIHVSTIPSYPEANLAASTNKNTKQPLRQLEYQVPEENKLRSTQIYDQQSPLGPEGARAESFVTFDFFCRSWRQG